MEARRFSEVNHQGRGATANAISHGEKRSNDTHASTSDSEARLYRKGNGQPTKLAFLGRALMENRHAMVVNVRPPLADD